MCVLPNAVYLNPDKVENVKEISCFHNFYLNIPFLLNITLTNGANFRPGEMEPRRGNCLEGQIGKNNKNKKLLMYIGKYSHSVCLKIYRNEANLYGIIFIIYETYFKGSIWSR